MFKRLLLLCFCFVTAVLIVFYSPQVFFQSTVKAVDGTSSGIYEQSVTQVNPDASKINKLYANGKFVGVLSDRKLLDRHLKEVYQSKYAGQYPNSALHLGKDVYLVEEMSYLTYSNIDDEIIGYLDENELYSLEATAVTFSNESGEYAEIYVSDQILYDNAMNTYLSYFIDSDSLAALQNGAKPGTLSSYGTQVVGVSVEQTIEISRKNASIDEIRTSEEEVLEFLEYGDRKKKEYYTVKEYDTVAGVGAKNFGLSATQVMNINRSQITSVDQVLEAGMKLCVTYFESPIDIVVYREKLTKEIIYFKTETVEDETMLRNTQEIRRQGSNGSRNAMYTEKWINGILVGGSLQTSIDLEQPVSEIVAVGTMQPNDVGTGSFRYPVNNAMISCPWGCYYGHRGTDFQNRYNKWEYAYAVDNGVVEEVGYNRISGNYIRINHNNGYVSYYGHFRNRTHLNVGDIVEKGDIVGNIGMTGLATGPHVHFFLEYNGVRKNACEVDIFPTCKGL